MTKQSRVEGEAFRLVYRSIEDPQADSQKMRVRLYKAFQQMLISTPISEYTIEEFIESEIGTRVSNHPPYYILKSFFDRAPVEEIVSAVTLIYRAFAANNKRKSQSWIETVNSILRQENVAYEVDAIGGVHPFVDELFQQTRVQTLGLLQESRYQAVELEFNNGMAALRGPEPDTTAAVRNVFVAVEILFKLTCQPSAPHRLGAQEVRDHLKPVAKQVYLGDSTAINSANKLIDSLGDWVDGAHFYRHGPNTEKPLSPPLDLAIWAVSNGMSHIRWLVSLDKRPRSN